MAVGNRVTTNMKRKLFWFFNTTGLNHVIRNIKPLSISGNAKKIFLISLIMIFVFMYHTSYSLYVKQKKCFEEDYITLLCGTEKFGSNVGESVREIRPRVDNEANTVERQLINIARRISADSHIVLFTVINEAYLPFAYSWLCNTKTMDIHTSVLIVTTDKQSKAKLNSDWPDINVISMDMDGLSGNQSYSGVGYIKITVKRTELIQYLLLANIDVFVFEVDCLWLTNPVPGISFNERDDIIVNPVAGTNDEIFASGFIWLRRTCRTKIIWQKVTDLMVALGRKVEDLPVTAVLDTYDDENEQKYLARLIRDGYADVTLKMLPLEVYADGKWYTLTEEKRSKLRPLVINNNWIIARESSCNPGCKMDFSSIDENIKLQGAITPTNGTLSRSNCNNAKIDRAKKWNHWFVRDDLTCDMDLVHRTIYK